MFGLKLITKRELALYVSTISDLRREAENLKKMIEHERMRAEGAINALLIKSVKMAIVPDDQRMTEMDEDKLKERQFDIFGDETGNDDEKRLEELQQ
jgi:hypothetical protein